MKHLIRLNIMFLILLFLYSCSKKEEYLFQVEEVTPWCIVGFDSLDRSPEQRITMLKDMGFTKYGYEEGKEHLDQMTKEFKLAKENDIEISAVFLWLNAKRDSIGKLSPMNQQLLSNLKEVEQKPAIWLSFSNNFFEKRSQEEAMDYAIKMIQFIQLKADELGCKLALYNHHGWFGNPHHQVKILEELHQDSLTMVFNFHHAQEYVDEFPEIVKKIKPYLSHVNLNGVKKEGPQIVTIGEGDHEFEMINDLLNEGYNGPWGILGHIKTEDVQQVLKRNMEGLDLFNATYHQARN